MEEQLTLHELSLGQMQTNCFIVANNDTNEAMVFDPGDEGQRVETFLKDNGLTPIAVGLTHGHFDHIMGLPHLKEVYHDLPVYLGEEEVDVLANPELNLSSMMGVNLSMTADYTVKDGENLNLLGTTITCIQIPGHTHGGVCYYFAKEGWLISGDTLFQQSIGRTDFPTGDYQGLIDGIIQKLFVLPPETKVYSGHTPPTTIGEENRSNPFLM